MRVPLPTLVSGLRVAGGGEGVYDGRGHEPGKFKPPLAAKDFKTSTRPGYGAWVDRHDGAT